MNTSIVSGQKATIAAAARSTDTPAKPYEVRAARPVGLLLRVQPSGTRTFYVQLARGKRVRIGPAGTYTLKQAEERAKALLLDPVKATAPKTVAATLGEYLASTYGDHAQARLKNGAIDMGRVKTVWKSLLNKRMTDIAEGDVERLRNKRLLSGTAPATVNRDVAALSSVFTHYVKAHKGAAHPLADVSPLKVADDETVRYLTPAEAQRLRKALADRDAKASAGRANANQWRSARGYEAKPEIAGFADPLVFKLRMSRISFHLSCSPRPCLRRRDRRRWFCNDGRKALAPIWG